MRNLIREPLVHFLLMGALIFGVYQLTPAGHQLDKTQTEIRFSIAEIGQLNQQFQQQWRRPPVQEELDQMIENRVKQEILYREALAIGFDKDDEIVKRRMAQKMQFLAEDEAAAREPTTAELVSWFEKNSALFAQPPRLGFRQLYFSPDQRGARARDDAVQALALLAGRPADAEIASSLGDSSMFPNYYADRTPEYLGKEFGAPFAVAVAKLPVGAWQGPIESGFGWHLVFLDSVIPGRVPTFEEVEGEVRSAWFSEQKTLAAENAYTEMRARYTVLLPAPP
jgi:parvulin-like peptidyl-prolyl isomerase